MGLKKYVSMFMRQGYSMIKKRFKVDICSITPRMEERLKVDSLEEKYLIIPIKVVYAKDLDLFIIKDGHHRYYQSKRNMKETILVECKKQQNKTEMFRGAPMIDYKNLEVFDGFA